MQSVYLGRITYQEALRAQDEILNSIKAGGNSGCVIGFESEPVITLGVRAGASDLLASPEELAAAGFDVLKVDRGGQATLHNPGQLVIFPVLPVRSLGARRWIATLMDTTKDLAFEEGVALSCRSGAPGLFSGDGSKVVAVGVRIRAGVSTHGVAINVVNDLKVFALIRACGVAGAPVGRLDSEVKIEELFQRWVAGLVSRMSSSQSATAVAKRSC